jgi:hypothetical protein
MTSSGPVEPTVDEDAIAAFAAIQSDDTGTDTFQRYAWQAKLAVLTWLRVLDDTGVIAVVCEHVEDLAVVETTGFRFAQLKTRDKGSWSVAKICAQGHAVNRLATSYLLAEAAGIASQSRFEVWLEGPPSEDRDTTLFFTDPSSATAATKTKIRAFGLTGGKLTDFLKRLSVHCHRPSRQTIDAVIIRTMGASWQALTVSEIEHLYEALLAVAISAQAAQAPSVSLMEALQAAQLEPMNASLWEPVELKLLSLEQLKALCPPLATAGLKELLARAAQGEASMLELKLIRAGASTDTVQAAVLARAEADVIATKGRASGLIAQASESALDRRILSMAGSLVAVAASNATTIQRPAEFIFHSLMTDVANTAALDVENLYERDHRLIVGHLCGISDQRRYGWGVP